MQCSKPAEKKGVMGAAMQGYPQQARENAGIVA